MPIKVNDRVVAVEGPFMNQWGVVNAITDNGAYVTFSDSANESFNWVPFEEIRHEVEGDSSPYDTEVILGVPYGDGYNDAVQAHWRYEIDRIFVDWQLDPCYDFESFPEFTWALPKLVKMREAYYADIRERGAKAFESWCRSQGFDKVNHAEWMLLRTIYAQKEQIERLSQRVAELEDR